MKPIIIENAKTTFFSSKDEYLKFKAAWAEKARNKDISSADIVLYNLFRGKPSTNGFTSITRTVELANGADPDFAYKVALYSVRSTLQWQTKRKDQEAPKESATWLTITRQTLISLHEYLLRTM